MQIHVWKKVTSHRQHANMINYALSPLIENLTMMTSSKWKINLICIVENCLSYNIIKIWEYQVTWLMRYRKTLFTHRRWRSTKLVLFYEMMGYSWRKCLQNLKAITYVANEIQTKENAFMWTLTVIYISKMASYEVGVILWNDWLVMA